jgi:F0F1-type ATP synthase assembly protein I
VVSEFVARLVKKNAPGLAAMPDPKEKETKHSALRSGGLLLSIPTLLIISPLVGFFLGSALDRWLKTSPWIAVIGLVLGFVAAGRETHRIYRLYLADEEQERKKRP